MDASTSRVFFAFWPDDQVRSEIGIWATEVCKLLGGKATQDRNLHMTVVFVGDIPTTQVEQLADIARGIDWSEDEKVEITLGQVDWWKHNKICYLGPASEFPEKIIQTVQQIREGLLSIGLTHFDKKPFVPHVTLARKVQARNGIEALSSCRGSVCWRLSKPVLVISSKDDEGIIYIPIY